MSPGNIAAEAAKGPRFLQHILAMPYFSEKTARATVEKLCNSTTGNDRNGIALKLGRYMAWDEDYKAASS